MSIYKVPEPDDEMECPYDNTHMIRAKRFPYHLIKCRKNYRGRDYVTCPFNARHELPRPELRYHVANCPDRALIYRDVLKNQKEIDEDYKGNTTVPNYKSDWDNHYSEENWDDEAPPAPAVMFYGKKKKAFIQDHRHGSDIGTDFMDEPSAAPVQQLRLPHQTPKVLEAAKVQSKANTAAPKASTVFSMSMAGIGRGRGLPQRNAEPGVGAARPIPAPAQDKPKPVVAANPRMAANIFGNAQNAQAVPEKPTNYAESLTALSRGRGFGLKAKAPAVGRIANGYVDSSPDLSPVRPGDSAEQIRNKEIRKLQKKLRSIEATENKQEMGEQLDDAEMEKVAQKQQIIQQLSDLGI